MSRKLIFLLLAWLCCAGPTFAGDAPPAFTLAGDHPLNGRIWQPGHGFISVQSLVDQTRAADFVLLGETHDNADHHALQAWMVGQIAAVGAPPLLAFEMIDNAQGPALSAYLAAHPKDAQGLGAALDWEKSGWPDWRFYAPIAQAGLEAGGVLAAANLSRAETRTIATTESSPGQKPQDPLQRQAMADDIQAGHCHLLPASALPAMVRVQRGRDEAMAHALAGASRAILIAGSGHVRTDRAVPVHLRDLAPGAKVFALAFMETDADAPNPADYVTAFHAAQLPFDAVWFTPKAEREDQCEAFKRQMDKKKG